MKKNNAGLIIVFILAGIALFIGYKQSKDREQNFSIADGYIYSVETSSKSTYVFSKYYFTVNQKKFFGNRSIPCPSDKCFPELYKLLKGKILKVAYEKDNPENNEMLFQSKIYKRYNLEPSVKDAPIVYEIDNIIANNK